MKLWKLHIYFEDNGTIVRFPGKLDAEELNAVTELIAGVRHIHRNPKRKPRNDGGFPYSAPPAEKENLNA